MGSYVRMLLIWIGLLFSVYAFWKWYSPIFMPFLGAFVLSVWLEPLVHRMERWGLSRAMAAFVTLGAAMAALLSIVVLLVSVMVTELAQVVKTLPALTLPVERIASRVLFGWSQLRQVLGLNPGEWHSQLGSVMRLLESILRTLGNFLVHLPDSMLMLMVALIAAFFMMRDKEHILQVAVKWVPPPIRPYVHHVHDDILAGALGFLKAQGTLIALTTFGTMAGLIFFGFKYAVLIGVLAGLLDFVPYMGPTTLLAPWAVVAFLSGAMMDGVKVLTVMLGVALLRQFTEPRLVGQNMGLHPLVALAALYFGVRLFGPAGFILGPISAVVIKVLAEVLVAPPGDIGV
ncbi:MAG: sporulation integral membrane protein YtvI [Sulfobacillus thermotolerans]|nr:sporulation integral membrane protein YtvI [Sulfobacillus thermotolerans]